MVADHDHPAGENQSASRPIDDAMPEPRVGSPVPPVGQTDDSTSADDASESSDEFVDANDTLASLTPPVPASGTSFVERTPSITPAEPTLTAKDDTHVVEREDDHRPSPTLVSVSPKPAPVQPFSSMTHRLPTNADIVSAPPASEASSSGVLPPVAPLPPSISGVYETDWEPDDDAYLKYLHAKTHMPFAPPSEPASLPLAAYTSVPQPPRPTAIKHLQAALPSSSTDPITTAPAQGPPSSRRAATPPSEPGPSKKRRTLPNTFDDAHVFKKPPRAAVSVVAVSPPAPPRVPPHSLTLSQSDEDDLFAEAAREITRPHAKSTSSSKRPQEVGDLAGPKRRRMDSEGAAPTEQRSFSASLSTAKNTKASQSHPGLLSRVLHWHSQEDQPEASSSNAPPNQL
ncbi:hypothetical protein DM01DRAFT_50076 [Hesseltinella vesiculosa]|uniref:Uncharacterized protein n=1 Tax=Hesseltinella vesiculosa TaxID=101127 RepID=A0A1X2G8F1_9FUNG|nr:hypothetical protein DM01DRAFT_50076 [Hesseltinella vesiculosa]